MDRKLDVLGGTMIVGQEARCSRRNQIVGEESRGSRRNQIVGQEAKGSRRIQMWDRNLEVLGGTR